MAACTVVKLSVYMSPKYTYILANFTGYLITLKITIYMYICICCGLIFVLFSFVSEYGNESKTKENKDKTGLNNNIIFRHFACSFY